jgi:hypothetical protein
LDLERQFECVRVTDLRTVDLARFRFDFDLTFAAITMGSDGTVLHRYGGRDAKEASSHLSVASFVAFLKGSLVDAKEHSVPIVPPPVPPGPFDPHHPHHDPAPPPDPKPGAKEPAGKGAGAKDANAKDSKNADAGTATKNTIEQIPAFAKRDKQKRLECVHCHNVYDFEYQQHVADGRWTRDEIWHFPDLARIGLEVDRDDAQRVVKVEPNSPAAKGGVLVGERIVKAGRVAVLTRADVQWALEQLPATSTALTLVLRKDYGERTASIPLPGSWKECDAREYAWRPYKWHLSPHPGFGGPALTSDEKSKLGLPPAQFAQRVQYLVDWGDQAASGKSAIAAGLAKGDVVLSVAGKSDFDSPDHFQAWYRFTQKVGDEVELAVLRKGERLTLRMKVVE